MLATKDFHKALNVIFGVRKHNLMCAQDMIRILRAKYDKEKRDYILNHSRTVKTSNLKFEDAEVSAREAKKIKKEHKLSNKKK